MKKLNAFCKAFELKQKMLDEKMWIMGVYVQCAVSTAVEHNLAGKKAKCGYVKTGNEKITLQGNKKHGTKHNEYVCYECGYKNDRDENAVLNLLALAK